LVSQYIDKINLLISYFCEELHIQDNNIVYNGIGE